MKTIELIEELSHHDATRMQPMLMRVRCEDADLDKVQKGLRKAFEDKGKPYHEKVK